MRKTVITFVLIISSQLLIAQEKCETKSGNLIALNTINKCAAVSSVKENHKTTRHLATKKTSSRIRFLKTRIEYDTTTSLKKESNQLPKKHLNK